MNETELKNYHEIFTAAWKFFKKHIDMDGSDEAYRLMLEDGSRQANSFDLDERFAEELYAAVSHAVQRYEMGRRGSHDTDQGSLPG